MEHPAQGKRVGLPLSELISLESYGVDRTVKFSLSFDEDLAKKIKQMDLIAVISQCF